ncbi:MAG: hypothetical protein ACTSQV_08455, partial [Alphaproteobacteria bacterium]
AARAMMDRVEGGEETLEEILNKPESALTRNEIDRVIASDNAMSRGHVDHRRANDMVTSWFERVYGGLDCGQGDIAESRIAPIAMPAPAPGGGTVIEGAGDIVRETVRDAAGIGLRPAVAKLQDALNSTVNVGKQLIRDGEFGPKTGARLRQAIARQGTDRVRDAYQRAVPPERI